MPQVTDIGIHPVKALDRISIDSARITKGAIVENDRKYALYDHEQGHPINGIKRDQVHDLTASFDSTFDVVTMQTNEGEEQCFDLKNEPEEAANWFSDFFGAPITIQEDSTEGFVSRPESGPSVISTETLEEVASWFDDVTVAGLRRRLRVNVEVSGVQPFWEDQFVGENPRTFRVGDVRFVGIEPCGRCVIPQRDPDTGELTQGFRKTFIERREETFPEWVDWDAFDHYFNLMLIADVPESDREQTIQVGDEVTIVEEEAPSPYEREA